MTDFNSNGSDSGAHSSLLVSAESDADRKAGSGGAGTSFHKAKKVRGAGWWVWVKEVAKENEDSAKKQKVMN